MLSPDIRNSPHFSKIIRQEIKRQVSGAFVFENDAGKQTASKGALQFASPDPCMHGTPKDLKSFVGHLEKNLIQMNPLDASLSQ